MDRAYAILNVKSVDDDERVIEGIASTPEPDREGDIIEPMGAKFALPMPLLWQHKHDKPIGHVEFARPTKAGIPFKARISKVDEPGTLKDRVDEAWQSVKYGLVRAVSVGFLTREGTRLPSGGVHHKVWEWLELSLVTIPMNGGALVTAVKSLDREHLPASRENGADGQRKTLPGASGTTPAALRGAVKLIPRNRK
jgi:HK97 family phage prohead protease